MGLTQQERRAANRQRAEAQLQDKFRRARRLQRRLFKKGMPPPAAHERRPASYLFPDTTAHEPTSAPKMEPTNIALEHEKLRPELERTTKLLADIRGCSVEELNARELATLQDFANRIWRLRGQHESDGRMEFANEVTPPRGIRAKKRPAPRKRPSRPPPG